MDFRPPYRFLLDTALLLSVSSFGKAAFAKDVSKNLAKKFANPIASLISVSLFAGLRNWAVSPDNRSRGLGARAGFAFLLPAK